MIWNWPRLITRDVPEFNERFRFLKFPNQWTHRFAEDWQGIFIVKWWWFSILEFDTDIYYTWRHPHWYWMVWWRYIAGPFFRLLIRVGFWKIKEGDYYTNGHPFWKRK